jgi:nucleoside-diphosphate-sugar epimerase
MGSSKKIIVTGGAGFVGSHIVRRLVKEGCDVTIFAKKTTNTDKISDILSYVTILHEDLSDPVRLLKQVKKIMPAGIFHFAASNIQSGLTSSNEEVTRVNISGTVNLLSSLSEIPYDFFIQTGSFLECGIKKHPLREDDFPEPGDLYSISKLAGTLFGQAEAKKNNKPILTFRLFTPYGPDIQKGRLVRNIIENALKNEPIYLTSPNITRDFIFIEDVCDLLFSAIPHAKEFSGEIFNLGSGIASSLETLVNEVLQITDSKSKVMWGTFHSVAYDSDTWCADMSKTFSSFSWQPKNSLQEGLIKTINHFKKIK